MEQPDEHYSLVGGNLVINNPKQKHAGTYICVARNIYGTVISKEARIKFGCELLKDAGAKKSHLVNGSMRFKRPQKVFLPAEAKL